MASENLFDVNEELEMFTFLIGKSLNNLRNGSSATADIWMERAIDYYLTLPRAREPELATRELFPRLGSKLRRLQRLLGSLQFGTLIVPYDPAPMSSGSAPSAPANNPPKIPVSNNPPPTLVYTVPQVSVSNNPPPTLVYTVPQVSVSNNPPPMPLYTVPRVSVSNNPPSTSVYTRPAVSVSNNPPPPGATVSVNNNPPTIYRYSIEPPRTASDIISFALKAAASASAMNPPWVPAFSEVNSQRIQIEPDNKERRSVPSSQKPARQDESLRNKSGRSSKPSKTRVEQYVFRNSQLYRVPPPRLPSVEQGGSSSGRDIPTGCHSPTTNPAKSNESGAGIFMITNTTLPDLRRPDEPVQQASPGPAEPGPSSDVKTTVPPAPEPAARPAAGSTPVQDELDEPYEQEDQEMPYDQEMRDRGEEIVSFLGLE